MSRWLDDAAQGLSSRRYSRRQVLGRAATVAGGGLLASAARPVTALARSASCANFPCLPPERCCDGRDCYDPRTQQCCDGKVIDPKQERCCSKGKPTEHVCAEDQDCCGRICCSSGESCCQGRCIDRSKEQCCVRYVPKTKTYAERICKRGQRCCYDEDSPAPRLPTGCCEKDEECCGSACCKQGESCCAGRCIDRATEQCCVRYLPRSKTYAQRICKRGQKCCYDPKSSPPGLPKHCCDKSETCCGPTGCCKKGEVCCGGQTCCTPDKCKDGRCGGTKCPPGVQDCFGGCDCTSGWKCCPSGNCTGVRGSGVCCAPNTAATSGGLSTNYTPCCTGGVFGVICGGSCCPNDRPCCGGKTCCPPGTIGCRSDGTCA